MKRLFFFWCLWLSSLAMTAIDTKPFRMQAPPTRTISILKSFDRSGVYTLKRVSTRVEEAGIDATVSLHSDTSMVRIFLDDAQGGSHLLLECLPRYAEGKMLVYKRQGEETISLGGIVPTRLRVVVKDARISLERLSLSNVRAQTRSSEDQSVDERRRLQVRAKVEAINRYNRSHEKYWRAKETGISLLPFAERQKMMSLSEEDDSQGWEFYGGGGI